MSERFSTALQELQLTFPGLREVVRADVDDEGGLTLTAEGEGLTRWFTHDDRGLIERFPERDAKLPLAERLAQSNDWKTLSYRPGRRVVVLVERAGHRHVIKGHKRGRSARAAVLQGQAEEAMRRGAFRVPRLLQHDGAREALLFAFLPGREVELVASSAPLYANLGQRLSVYQLDPSAEESRVFSVQDELEVLERWRAKVLRAVGSLPDGWTRAHERLLRRAAGLPAAHFGLCHRDLHDRQVHLDGEDIVLLDFDLMCRGDVALDPGNLIAHLRWRGLQGLHGAEPASCATLAEAFLMGLGRGSDPGFDVRLAFYTASAFLRLALVYRLRPRWSEQVTEMVAWACSTLDDLAPIG